MKSKGSVEILQKRAFETEIWGHATFQPLPFVCIYQIISFFCSLLFTRLQAQVEQEGMQQHVQCKVGMLSAFLDTVRLLSQLLRSVETFTIYILILSIILLLITVTLSYSNVSTNRVFVFSCTGQELQFHAKA